MDTRKREIFKLLGQKYDIELKLKYYTVPAKIEQENNLVTIKCPKCGTAFQQYHLSEQPFIPLRPQFPIICCDKIIVW
jgi:ribosomal protein S27AE